MGSGGSGSRSGPDTENRVNREHKRNRDGTRNTFGNTLGHIASHMGAKVDVGNKGVSVSASPTCGSCHDPYSGRRKK